MAITTDLDSIKAAITEDALFQRAANDCKRAANDHFAALLRRATVGRSIADATTQLDLLRQHFEKGPGHVRPPGRPTITIRLRKGPA